METGIHIEPATQGNSQSLFPSSSEKAKQKLAAVVGLNDALFQEPGMYQFANQSLDYAFSIVGGQAGSLLLASPESKHLQFFLSKGAKPVPRWTKVAWNVGIAGDVFHSGKSEFVSDAHNDPRHLHEIDQLTGYTTQNIIAIPIKRPDGSSMGVLEILNITQEFPSEEDTVFLQILSSFISMALHRDWDNQDTQREAMSNFLKDCAHDMKNLLMPILDGKEFLKQELVEIFGRIPYRETMQMQNTLNICQESLDMIDRNSRRLQKKAKDLVDCLMGLSAVKELKSCDIRQLTTEVLDTLWFPIQKKDLSIQIRGLENVPIIQADEKKLFSVIYNLLHNAIEAIQNGGTIVIQGYPENQHVSLTIMDNGPGMPQHEVDGLFSSKKRSKKSLGNGYGMKSIRNAVEEHGGYIKIQSQVGIGTTIHISLPVSGMTSSVNPNTAYSGAGTGEGLAK
ncbi:MAG: GAF domain-containing sensor histidine kinase [Nitrospirae bacterium]|nr:GAF domain-containing sensor histidine kinase [Nitrospirota bacterium]